jgi:hypothetical protein
MSILGSVRGMDSQKVIAPASAALEQIRARHQQHVSLNYPAPGICVSRDSGRWPCDAARLLSALEAALAQHEEFDGTCAGCTDAYGDPAAWPCEEYRAIAAALTRQDDR